MIYTFNKESVIDNIKREIARYASGAVTQEGVSLYDKFIDSSRDSATIDLYIHDAVYGLVNRMSDVASPVGEGSIEFSVPDFSAERSDMVSGLIDRYISMSVMGSWLLEKDSEKAEAYAVLANSAIESAVKLLKTRRKPQRL